MMTARLAIGGAAQVIDVPSCADRLTTKMLETFDLACDVEDLEAAEAMLKAVEDVLSRQGRHVFKHWGRFTQNLVDAHFRLWELRHLAR